MSKRPATGEEAAERSGPTASPDVQTSGGVLKGITARFQKQAIVVVHGMGEQRPMDTIRSFVETVWRQDPEATRNGMPDPTEVWSKPDERLGSFELRRITTRESAPSPGVFERGVRSDFYELYWADLTAGSPWDDFVSWLSSLLLRNPFKTVPAAVLSAWIALWVVTIVFVLIGIWALIPPKTEIFGWKVPDGGQWRWLVLAVIAAATVALHKVVNQTFGRVVRYTQATPSNIAARQAVRERGLALLETLHGDRQYDRIVLVGHSLGSILAYELLAFFWARQSGARRVSEGSPEFNALQRLEQAAAALEKNAADAAALEAWSIAQRDLRLSMASRPAPNPSNPSTVDRRWIISDFVTLGSPLTHAEFLLAANKEDLTRRQREREMPTAPPIREVLDPADREAAIAAGGFPISADPRESRLFCYPWRDEGKNWDLHHAAVFAVVRWTNIHDPARHIIFGDLISGPLRPVFGPAIRDINLQALRGESSRFSHTRYWHPEADEATLKALRAAVNIMDRPQPHETKPSLTTGGGGP